MSAPLEITVDGQRYVRADSLGQIKIVVLERGFIYVGRVSSKGGVVTITGARSLIRWGTNAHLGQLVNGPLPNTKLGDRCTVTASDRQVIHLVEVYNNAWTNHAG